MSGINENGYSSGLLDCFKDLGSCMTYICCGVTGVPSAMAWAESRQEECGLGHCLAFASPVWTRANIRKLNGKPSHDYLADCCLYLCCGPCAHCQDSRELKAIAARSNPPLIPQGMHQIPGGQGYGVLPQAAPQYMNSPSPQIQQPYQ